MSLNGETGRGYGSPRNQFLFYSYFSIGLREELADDCYITVITLS